MHWSHAAAGDYPNFTARFGLQQTAGRPAPTLRPVIGESRTRLRILLAEDEPVNRLVAVRLLEKPGHTVIG